MADADPDPDLDTCGEDLADTAAWRAWRHALWPRASAAYAQWRADHGLGDDPDPRSLMAEFFAHGWIARGGAPPPPAPTTNP
jgi:hypothetical protein